MEKWWRDWTNKSQLKRWYKCGVCGELTPVTIEINHSPPMCDDCWERREYEGSPEAKADDLPIKHDNT